MTVVSDILNVLVNSKSVPIEKLKSISINYQGVNGEDVNDGHFTDIKPNIKIEFYEDEISDN